MGKWINAELLVLRVWIEVFSNVIDVMSLRGVSSDGNLIAPHSITENDSKRFTHFI
jgi:hypothetical protein